MDQDWCALMQSDSGAVLENDVRPSHHLAIDIGQQDVTAQQQYEARNLFITFPDIPCGQATITNPNHIHNFEDNAVTFDQVNTNRPPTNLGASSLAGNGYNGWQINNIPYNAVNLGTTTMSASHAPQVAQGHSGFEVDFFTSTVPAHLGAGLPAFAVSLSEVTWPLEIAVDARAKRNSRARTRDEDGDKDESRSRPIDWTKDRETLYHLYMVENMTAQEVADAMKLRGIQVEASTLRKRFNARDWPEFKKNKSTFQHRVKRKDRTRAAASLPNPRALRSTIIQTRKVREPRISPTPSRHAELLFPQESMLHAIERLILGSFDQKKRGVSPLLEAEHESGTWESLYSRCLGLAGMCKHNIGGKFYFLWNEFVKDLDAALCTSRGLALLVHFWRIAVCLWGELSFRVRVNHPSCFTFFFRIFLHNVRAHFRGKRPGLATIVDNLYQVLNSSPRDVKNTLGMGCIKTMGVIGSMTGLHHPFLLKMASVQYQYWKNGYNQDKQLQTRYKPLLGTVDFTRPTPDQIVVLTDYTLLQRHSKPETAPDMASILRNLTLERCQTAADQGVLTYNSAARALAFSTELLAVSQLDPVLVNGKPNVRERVRAFQDVSDAVDLLRRGDLECRVRAAELSRRLTIWYKTFISPNEANSGRYREQKKVTAMIMSQIDETRISVPEGRPLAVPPFRKRHKQQSDKKSPNNRLRRKIAEKGRIVVSMIKEEGNMNDIPNVNLEGGAHAPRIGKKEQVKGPAQTPSKKWPQGRQGFPYGT
ncbi:hypothetical protein MFIFM68171_02072 [Madurella fahalii]|uniref:Clr5 domain-containing protein n=1 Tax=Madurella fahalii TaxID=1157608 RepID=A0ABQ0G287_9PEZI